LSGGEEGAWVAAIVAGAELVAAPHLIDFEVASAVRGLTRGGVIGARRGELALASFARIRVLRCAARPLLHRIWELRGQIDAYDAAYVALAEQLDLPLVTTDARLSRAKGHSAEIIAFAG
jgi:predicted nucleic acid-binding protein